VKTGELTDYNKTDTSLVGTIFIFLQNIKPLALRGRSLNNIQLRNVLFDLRNVLVFLLLGLFRSLGYWLFSR
jgi:hypothetical protein